MGTALSTSAANSGDAFANTAVEKTAGGGDAVSYLVADANTRYVIQVISADDPSKFCNFLVTNVDSSTQVDLVLLTDTPEWDVADQDPVYILGSAYGEGTNKTYAFSDRVSQRWASCQIFKDLAKASRTTMKTWVAGGNEWERILAETGLTHKVGIERNFFFGGRVNTDGASQDPFGAPSATALDGTADSPVRTSVSLQQAAHWADEKGMGGSRVFNCTIATYTYGDFIDDMEKLFEFGSDTRYFFGGRGVLTVLAKMALNPESGIQYSPDNMDEFGIKYHKFVTPHGDLKFIPHRLFRGDYSHKAFAVDMNNIKLLVFDDTFVETDTKTPGWDGIEHQYVSDMGLEIDLPEATVAEFQFK